MVASRVKLPKIINVIVLARPLINNKNNVLETFLMFKKINKYVKI